MAEQKENEKLSVSAWIRKIPHYELLQKLANEKYPTIERNISPYIRDLIIEHLKKHFPELEEPEKEEEEN